MIKAVLFDFDETLQDRTKAFEGFIDAFLKEFLPDISLSDKEQYTKDMVITGNGGYVDREKWYAGLIEDWKWQNPPSPKVLADYYDTTFGDHNVIFEHTVPLLVELKKRGYKVGVITNGPSVLQNHKMDNSGLRKYCDLVLVSGDVGVHKPDKRIFEIAANQLGFETKECVYVGDHPVNDIQGALSSGMKAIRMNWGWFKNQQLREDVPVINDIIDVLNYV